MSFLESVGSWFLENEMVAILLSLCLGHLIGKINFGRFTLGSTVGTLLVAMIIGQSGTFSISSTAQMLFFMLCVFAIGYESGPAFVKGFKNAGMRVIGLSLFFVVVGTGLTVGLCKACGLDAGTSAGIFAGSLTQTAVIGTAGDAIASLGLDEAATAALQSNVSISYALTYFFGLALENWEETRDQEGCARRSADLNLWAALLVLAAALIRLYDLVCIQGQKGINQGQSPAAADSL